MCTVCKRSYQDREALVKNKYPLLLQTVIISTLLLHLAYLLDGPHRLIFTWWRCYGLCFWHKPAELAHSFLFCSCVYFCLYGPFNCISFHNFSQSLSTFSLCSSCLISGLFMKVSISPDIILWGWPGLKHQLANLCGWLGLKHQLTN